MGKERPFHGLQARGLEGTGSPLADISEMAAVYLAELRRVQPRGPYHLGGWSMGGLVAFEMACRLVADGEKVAFLALLDTPAPGREPRADLADEVLAASFAADLGIVPAESGAAAETIAGQGVDSFLRLCLHRLQEAQRMPPESDLSALRRLFDLYRVNAHAARRYRALPYAGPVTLFRAERTVPLRDDADGWRRIASQVESVVVPGDHHTLLLLPHVAQLAVQLERRL
jgi:thioesterase domain-containing protein